MPTTAPLMHVAIVPDRIERSPSAATSALRRREFQEQQRQRDLQQQPRDASPEATADYLTQWQVAFDELPDGRLAVPAAAANGAVLFLSEGQASAGR